MTVRERLENGVLHLRFEGDAALDYVSASRIKADSLARIDGKNDVVFDLSDVEFVDSAGLTVLVSLFKAVRSAGRESRFAGVHPGVEQVMKVIRLTDIFDIHPDVSTAVASLANRSA